MKTPKLYIVSAFVCSALFSQGAITRTVDFNVDDDGMALLEGNEDSGGMQPGLDIGSGAGQDQPYADLFGPGVGITFTDTGGNFLTLYNSDGTGGLDDDLESANFAVGNGTSSSYGNILIHQTNNPGQDANSTDNVNAPNDDGNGGTLVINSGIALFGFEFSFIDLDDGNVAGSSIIFTDTNTGQFATVQFADLEGTSSSVFSTAGADFGDHGANNLDNITIADLQTLPKGLDTAPDLTEFNQITIITAGSGGLGEFTVTIPEPSSSILVALGTLSLMVRRRR